MRGGTEALPTRPSPDAGIGWTWAFDTPFSWTKAPDMVDGIPQKPIEGVSMMYTFDGRNANAPPQHRTQYFEMMGDHAIDHDGWIARAKAFRLPWEPAGAVPQDPASYPYAPERGRQSAVCTRRPRPAPAGRQEAANSS